MLTFPASAASTGDFVLAPGPMLMLTLGLTTLILPSSWETRHGKLQHLFRDKLKPKLLISSLLRPRTSFYSELSHLLSLSLDHTLRMLKFYTEVFFKGAMLLL